MCKITNRLKVERLINTQCLGFYREGDLNCELLVISCELSAAQLITDNSQPTTDILFS